MKIKNHKGSSRYLINKARSTSSSKRVIRAFESLGFRRVREGEHIAMLKENADGSRTPLTMPNHSRLKSSTLRTICTQSKRAMIFCVHIKMLEII